VDRGKPGSKIHAISERAGLPLTVAVSAANLNDHQRLPDVVDSIRPVAQPVGRPRKRPAKLHADKGYDYPLCRRLLRARWIIPRIARRGIESSTRLGRHRYVIERTLEWISRFAGCNAATNARPPTSWPSFSWPARWCRRVVKADPWPLPGF
jgi:IS5 family transposase